MKNVIWVLFLSIVLRAYCHWASSQTTIQVSKLSSNQLKKTNGFPKSLTCGEAKNSFYWALSTTNNFIRESDVNSQVLHNYINKTNMHYKFHNSWVLHASNYFICYTWKVTNVMILALEINLVQTLMNTWCRWTVFRTNQNTSSIM